MILIDLVHIMVFLGLVGGFRMSDSYPPWDVYIYICGVYRYVDVDVDKYMCMCICTLTE